MYMLWVRRVDGEGNNNNKQIGLFTEAVKKKPFVLTSSGKSEGWWRIWIRGFALFRVYEILLHVWPFLYDELFNNAEQFV